MEQLGQFPPADSGITFSSSQARPDVRLRTVSLSKEELAQQTARAEKVEEMKRSACAKGIKSDPSFMVDKPVYDGCLDFVTALQAKSVTFDIPAHLAGQHASPTLQKNNAALLKEATDMCRAQAQELVKQGAANNLQEAYKKLIAVFDQSDAKDSSQSSYFSRTAILYASQADGVGLETWMAYTKGGKPERSAIWPFLENGKNWIPEAQGARAKWIEATVVKTKALSSTHAENKVVLLKGGFGAGKTRLINQLFGNLGQGAIAPDKAKEIDRRANPTLPHSTAHIHGSQAAFELMNKMIEVQQGTVVYDSSLSNPDDVARYLAACKMAGKKMEIYDVARNDMARALSVLKRPVDGEDPRIPPDFIIRSAINDKVNRVKCMEVILNDTTVEKDLQPVYHLVAGDRQGWNTEEVMQLSSNGKISSNPKAADRLALEGIELSVDQASLKLTTNRQTLEQFFTEQFERPVKDIKSELSEAEQASLKVFSERTFIITKKSGTKITDATSLYQTLPKEIREALPQTAFEDAFASLKEETRKQFFASIEFKDSFSYEDLPLRAALYIHQNLQRDPWK